MFKILFNLFILVIFFISNCFSFKIAILGASSHLGREIIYQGLDRQISILALTSKYEIYAPYRANSFIYKSTEKIINSKYLNLENYWLFPYYNYDHLIISVKSKNLDKDYTDDLILKFIDNLSPCCQSISFISKYNSVYLNKCLKDKYLQQEQLINKRFSNNVKKLFYRPTRLSFGNTILNSKSRKDLAQEILDNIVSIHC